MEGSKRLVVGPTGWVGLEDPADKKRPRVDAPTQIRLPSSMDVSQEGPRAPASLGMTGGGGGGLDVASSGVMMPLALGSQAVEALQAREYGTTSW